MGLFDRLKTRDSRLEVLVSEIDSNMSNNYKDAAQAAFKELLDKFSTLSEEGKLNERQKAYYGSIIEHYGQRLKGYSHKDQKPYWTGK